MQSNQSEPQKGTMEETEFDARTFIKKARTQNWKNGGVLAFDDEELIEELENTLHHQLQKARHDWLREEIVKLEGMKLDIYLGDEYLAGFNEGFNTAINDTVQRYQAELDPVHDFFTAPEEVQRPVYERALQKAQEEQEKLTNNQTL